MSENFLFFCFLPFACFVFIVLYHCRPHFAFVFAMSSLRPDIVSPLSSIDADMADDLLDEKRRQEADPNMWIYDWVHYFLEYSLLYAIYDTDDDGLAALDIAGVPISWSGISSDIFGKTATEDKRAPVRAAVAKRFGMSLEELALVDNYYQNDGDGYLHNVFLFADVACMAEDKVPEKYRAVMKKVLRAVQQSANGMTEMRVNGEINERFAAYLETASMPKMAA